MDDPIKNFVYINTYSEAEINSVCLMLKESGIEYKKEMSQSFAGYGYIGPHEVKIFVPESKFLKAKKILGIDKNIDKISDFEPLKKLNQPLHAVVRTIKWGLFLLLVLYFIISIVPIIFISKEGQKCLVNSNCLGLSERCEEIIPKNGLRRAEPMCVSYTCLCQ